MNDIKVNSLKSTPDNRDFHDKDINYSFPFPTKYKTEIHNIPVESQNLLGVCSAVALTSYIEHLYYNRTGKYVQLSVAFLYIIAQNLIEFDTVEGISPRAALKAAKDFGVCTEKTFPTNYNLSHTDFMNQTIPQKAFDEAQKYKIGAYCSIPIEPSFLMSAIYKYGMVYARMALDEKWWKPSFEARDIMPLKKPKKDVSGHAIDIYGYDDVGEKTKMFLLNSWGNKWGYNGTGEFFFEDYEPYLTEAWAITLDPTINQTYTPSMMANLLKQLSSLISKVLFK